MPSETQNVLEFTPTYRADPFAPARRAFTDPKSSMEVRMAAASVLQESRNEADQRLVHGFRFWHDPIAEQIAAGHRFLKGVALIAAGWICGVVMTAAVALGWW
jgi:hypothetical protein